METPPSAVDRACVLWAVRPPAAERAVLFGLTPVERTALAFARAGVRRFVLAGDPQAVAELGRVLATGPCKRLRVRSADTLALACAGEGPVLLARADCHYDRQLIWRFVAETAGAAEAVVAIDFRPEAVERGVALPQATAWSREPRARVQRVGRRLVGADGVLVGLALATPAFVRAIDRGGAQVEPGEDEEPPAGPALHGADADPERAWLNGLSALLAREPVASWAVVERWQPVQRPEDVPRARREVLAGAVRVTDGIIARHLNRPISLRITERLLSQPVKPWQVSLASFATTLAAGLSFAIGHATTGGLLAQAASVLDGVDGELARVRYQDSAFGGLYDALLDRVGEAAVIGGMTAYAWVMGAGAWVVALGFAALAGNSLSMLVKEKYGTQFRRPWAVEREGRWRWLLLGRDGRLFLTLVAGVTGQVELVLAYLALGTHVHAGARIARVRSEATARV
jgi:CDP-L-myo-inositol myo-inositolphosphotransferase